MQQSYAHDCVLISQTQEQGLLLTNTQALQGCRDSQLCQAFWQQVVMLTQHTLKAASEFSCSGHVTDKPFLRPSVLLLVLAVGVLASELKVQQCQLASMLRRGLLQRRPNSMQ